MSNLTLLYILSGIGSVSALLLLGYFIYLLTHLKELINRVVLNYIFAGVISCIFYGLLHNILSHPVFFNSLIHLDFSNTKIQAYFITWIYRAAIYFPFFAIWLRILLVKAKKSGRKTGVFRMLFIHAALISTAWITDFEKLLYYGGTIDVHHLTHWIGGIIGCGLLLLLEYVFMERKIIEFLDIRLNFQRIRNKLLIITFGMSGLLLLSVFGIAIGCHTSDPSGLFLGKLVLYSIFLLIPLLLIILRITADFQKNLYSAVSALKSAAKQDFTYNVEIDSKDEFGTLAESLKELRLSFHRIIRKVKDSTSEVHSSAVTINESLNNLVLNVSDFFTRQSEMTGIQVRKSLQAQEDVKKIADSITAITKELNSQSEMITETSGLIHRMETSIAHITHQTESADNQANILFTIADEGKKSILSTLNSIQNVESKSVQIQDLSGMISEISDRTHILAINTGIEAANIGENGRGFRILAQELRNLASISLENSGTITGYLKEINVSIRESLKRMEISREGFLKIHNHAENSRQLNSTIHNAMKDENTLLDKITSISNRLIDITDSINTYSKHLSENSSLIYQVFIDFQKRASGDEESFRENSNKLQELINRMKNLIQRNLKISDELNSDISEFRI
ncbi:MAG: methyl-accepting chemotaxis protein [Spirochaetales bacterium]|nr:methyl-accepting chemotaxis protein [Spirochaetales bacterium]